MKKSTLLQFLGFPCCDNYDVNRGESGLNLDFSESNSTDCCCPDDRGDIKSKGINGIIMLFILFLFSNLLTAQIKIDGLSNSSVGEWNQAGIRGNQRGACVIVQGRWRIYPNLLEAIKCIERFLE